MEKFINGGIYSWSFEPEDVYSLYCVILTQKDDFMCVFDIERTYTTCTYTNAEMLDKIRERLTVGKFLDDDFSPISIPSFNKMNQGYLGMIPKEMFDKLKVEAKKHYKPLFE